jgi:AcrR family transcriptional regulator
VAQQATPLPVHAGSEPTVEATPDKTEAFGAFEGGLQHSASSQASTGTATAAVARIGRPYRGLNPDERRAARRQRLLDAGLASFGTIGYGATSIEQLCTDAGVTPRHFYEEFSSREALLSAVYDNATRFTHEASQVAVAAAANDPESRTRAAVEGFVHAMCDDPRRARVLCVEGVRVNAEFERHRREVIQAFADLTAAQTRRLPLPDRGAQRRMRPMVLFGVVHELVIEWLVSDSPPPLEQLIDELTGIWLAAGPLL